MAYDPLCPDIKARLPDVNRKRVAPVAFFAIARHEVLRSIVTAGGSVFCTQELREIALGNCSFPPRMWYPAP